MPQYLSLDIFKQRRRIDHDDHDVLLSDHLDSAESYLGDLGNGILNRPVIVQEFKESFKDFSKIDLRYPDDVSEISILYTDPLGNLGVLNEGFFIKNGALALHPNRAWPEHKGDIEVIYRAGWEPSQVPAALRSAGYFIAGQYYDYEDDFDETRFRSVLGLMLAGLRRMTI